MLAIQQGTFIFLHTNLGNILRTVSVIYTVVGEPLVNDMTVIVVHTSPPKRNASDRFSFPTFARHFQINPPRFRHNDDIHLIIFSIVLNLKYLLVLNIILHHLVIRPIRPS